MHARATLKCQKIIKEMLQNKLSLHLNAHENFMIIYDNEIILTSLATFLLLMFQMISNWELPLKFDTFQDLKSYMKEKKDV